MTKILIDRAVVEEVIATIEDSGEMMLAAIVERQDRAVEALRAALAEPVQKPQGCDHCNHWLYAGIKCRMCGRVTEPTTEEPSAVEPVQEPVKPVAWLYRGNLHPFDPSLDRASDPATPLYAHPPQPAEPVQEPFALPCPTPKACKAHCCSGNCIPRIKA